MNENLEKALEALYAELKGIDEKSAEIKKNINSLSAYMGKSQPFTEAEMVVTGAGAAIRRDQFFGQPLASCVKEYLRMRGHAATGKEIYDALKSGGFDGFKGKTDQIQYRNLTISLGKNTTDFVYVKSSNAYGLYEFYPEKLKERKKNRKDPEKEVTLDEIFGNEKKANTESGSQNEKGIPKNASQEPKS